MTTEQKVKAYDEAIKRAKAVIKVAQNQKEVYDCIITIFPELKESEEEKIRKDLIGWFEDFPDMIWRGHNCRGHYTKDIIKWLENQDKESSCKPSKEQISALEHFVRSIGESGYASPYDSNTNLINSLINDLYKIQKQGEQKPADKSEPKFKVGNWYLCIKDFFGKGVTFDKNATYYCAKEGCLQNEYGCHIAIVKELYDNFKLWDISDAKEGDILAGGDWVFVFKKFHINGFPKCHCHYDMTLEEFKVDTDSYMACGRDIYPATKEQRDLLFAKMEESNYKWDANKKKLSKIEQKNDILTDFEYSLKHIMEEAIECGDTHNLKADADMLLRLAQKPIKWNEEDEDKVKEIIEYLNELYNCDRFDLDELNDKERWLKSLKERIRWKPSEKQMNALDSTLQYSQVSLASSQYLNSLYNDLKKLTK